YTLENMDNEELKVKDGVSPLHFLPLLSEKDKKEEIYTLIEDNRKKASEILLEPFMILYTLENMDNEELKVKDGVSPLHFLPLLSEKDKKEILNKLDKIPDSTKMQTAILSVLNEYEKVGIDINSFQINYILKSGFVMLSVAFLIMIVAISITFLGSRLAARLGKSLRSQIFKKVMSFSKTEMKTFGTASLITRTTNDIQQVQGIIVFMMRIVVYAPIMAFGGIIKTYNASNSLIWIVGIAVICLFTMVGTLFLITMPKFTMLQKLIDRLNQVSREILTGIPVIRAFANEKYEEQRFDKANTDLTKVSLFVDRTMSIMMPTMMLIMNVVSVLIVWIGSYQIDKGSLQVGNMMACIQYSVHIIMSFLMMSMLSIMLPRANVSAKRIMEIIDTENVIQDPLKAQALDKSKKGVVEFKNVCFRYPDANEDVMTDISFVAKPGTTTAFIGSTGSGKSTLINLIPRLYDVTEGIITVDGVDIRKMKLKTLRDKIGFVPQKGILFKGTVESNIKYKSDNITNEEMENAAKISQSKEFINKLNKKYKSEIVQGGTNVSGGQRQRLSIARAIAANPDIYIFDDSFSALDFKTDVTLRGELKEVTKDKTVLIVAQRISTIMNADNIIVLDEGKIVGMGKHKQLLKDCEVYKEIAYSQLSKEEL
ncbi:MAG: ABC transporter ATP-binding protein, partial [Bacilli bacterium]|nr:ABC transporter ATP-binding protein [Bacilli bacterium]